MGKYILWEDFDIQHFKKSIAAVLTRKALCWVEEHDGPFQHPSGLLVYGVYVELSLDLRPLGWSSGPLGSFQDWDRVLSS